MNDYSVLKSHNQRIHEASLREAQLRAKHEITGSTGNPLFRANLMSVSIVLISFVSLILFFAL